ncbi:Os08g0500400 [Oryza sativa Japonica Group]|uniref:Os08g0500400 protein n=2 Tax=Oryza sativa subsp. japonica TaxID=39947 RepID=A0A0P0XHP2_ORYSJ|nr:hypothetical protein EE612_045161 [Oryza sativa]BAD08815.1 unknown protein [Oryza sativa Japonica Group]BAF24070.1 Os08g0500400 [Oryza sativa Japonica Group]BAT06109.1 Os08g0500400 [Oryza sativa Japonica Group]|eukprot:NP_001062156.1 Os08g0500400 [Oryza sativa Japonica Group]
MAAWLTSHTTMASWLVPFRPCCVCRHAAALAPLTHTLPSTFASSSSVISPPPPPPWCSFLPPTPMEKTPPPPPETAPPRSTPRCLLLRHRCGHPGDAPAPAPARGGRSEERQEPMAAAATRRSTELGNRFAKVRIV